MVVVREVCAACVLTRVGALDKAGFVMTLGGISGSRGGGKGVSLGFSDPIHSHEHTGELLQGHVPQLRGERTRGVLQTHQPAGVSCVQTRKQVLLLNIQGGEKKNSCKDL